jgi:hypothetical protein
MCHQAQPTDLNGGESVTVMGVRVQVADIGADLGGLLVTTPDDKIVIVDSGLSDRRRTAVLADLLDDEEFAEVHPLSA